MRTVIYHNPGCGTSKTVLGILSEDGQTPTVIEYMKTGWTRPQLLGLFASAGITAHDALRTFKTKAEELGLTADGVSEDTIIDAMVADPVLVNRPFVCTANGVRLCRPADTVHAILSMEA